MTHDSFSDLVLLSVCMGIAYRCLTVHRERAGVGIACLLIGIAAFLGVIRFSDWKPIHELAEGPHRFASTIAAVGAFPILAYSLAFPKSPIATRLAGAWWFTFVVGGFGMAVWLLGFKLWAQIVPALCALWMAVSVAGGCRGRRLGLGIAGLVFLFASFGVTLFLPASTRVLGIFKSIQMFHYFLATALALIALATVPPTPPESAR